MYRDSGYFHFGEIYGYYYENNHVDLDIESMKSICSNRTRATTLLDSASYSAGFFDSRAKPCYNNIREVSLCHLGDNC